MLHRLSRLKGFHIHATDGPIGHVDDVLVDETTWAIQYLVVDTSNFIGGKWVVLSPATILKIEWGKLRVDVTMTRDQIKNGPTLDNLDVPPAEKWPSHAFIF
jgi:sporulation protein YlmC with PRC-barrel domain